MASCADEMMRWARKSGYDKPVFCFINMASVPTSSSCKGDIMKAILDKIGTSLGIGRGQDVAVLKKHFKKRVVVLILDEIDMLFKQHGVVGGECFKTLVYWAESRELKLSLIGISNSVNDDNATRVRELGNVSLGVVSNIDIEKNPILTLLASILPFNSVTARTSLSHLQ